MLPLQFGLGHTELQSTTKSQRLDCLREERKRKKKKATQLFLAALLRQTKRECDGSTMSSSLSLSLSSKNKPLCDQNSFSNESKPNFNIVHVTQTLSRLC